MSIVTCSIGYAQTTTFGYVEGYYAHSVNQTSPGPIAPFLYNFNRHNAFNVNLALAGLKATSDDWRGVFSIHTGTYSQDNYAAEPEAFKHIYEAYGGVQVVNNLWLDAGIFSSQYGAESAIGKDNWTLTRSMYAENSPYFESGAKLTYTPAEQVTIAGMLLNGWQNIQETNSNKAIGTQIQYKPAPQVLLNSSLFVGNEKPDSASQTRIFHDFYIIYQPTEALGIQAVFDYGMESASVDSLSASDWFGLAVTARYKLSDKFAVALRGEHYNDKNGVIIATGTNNGFQTTGFSINADYIVSPNAMIRLEAKNYNSKDKIFVKDNTLTSSNTIITSSLAISL